MTRRLIGWAAFVLLLTALAYTPRVSGDEPVRDIAYRWESSVIAIVQVGIFVGVVLLLTLGLDRSSFLGLRRPRSWGRAAAIAILVLVATFLVSAAISPFGDPEREQGLIPHTWDSSRAAQFAAFALAVTVLAPVAEELLFRGAGYGLLEPLGPAIAVVVVGVSFGLIHGLVAGFPVIATFGAGLAYLRARTGSIYPCMILHGAFNALALGIGVST
jgi:uncharacterized protein